MLSLQISHSAVSQWHLLSPGMLWILSVHNQFVKWHDQMFTEQD